MLRKTYFLCVVLRSRFPENKSMGWDGAACSPTLTPLLLACFSISSKIAETGMLDIPWYSNSMNQIFCIKLWEYKMLNFHHIFNFLVVNNCPKNRSEVMKSARCASWDLKQADIYSLHLKGIYSIYKSWHEYLFWDNIFCVFICRDFKNKRLPSEGHQGNMYLFISHYHK